MSKLITLLFQGDPIPEQHDEFAAEYQGGEISLVHKVTPCPARMRVYQILN
jgi:hypothetical protein